jgi:hypothetical protein
MFWNEIACGTGKNLLRAAFADKTHYDGFCSEKKPPPDRISESGTKIAAVRRNFAL